MSSWKKEPPYIIIENDKGNTYRIDLKTNIIYGASGKPVRNIPYLGNSCDYYERRGAYTIARLFSSMTFCSSDNVYNTYKLPLREIADTLSSLYDEKVITEYIVGGYALTLCEMTIPTKFILKNFPSVYNQIKKKLDSEHFNEWGFYTEINKEIEKRYLCKMHNLTTEEYEEYKNLYGENKRAFLNPKFRVCYHRVLNNPKLTCFLGYDTLKNKTFEYAKYCDKLGWEYDNGNFIENYVKAKRTYEAMKEEIDNRLFAETQSILKPFEDENYTIVIPTTRAECIAEGTALHNCIGTIEWNSYLSQGKRCIIFIREKSNPDKPFFAADFSTDNYYVNYQTRGNFNNYSTEVGQFVKEYRKFMLNSL